MAMRIRILPALVAALVAQGASLDDVLARIDTAAKQFKSYSATAKVIEYRKLFPDDKDEQTGSFRLRRIKNSVSGIMDLSAGQDPKVLHFNGPTVEIYLPKAGETHVYKVGQYTSMLNRMLLLGFSVSRDEMKKDYSLALGSAEKMGSTPATRIILTPKSREVLKNITAIDLWIPDGQGYAIRQKITRHNGDYDLTEYSNLHLNGPLPDSAFELNTPPGIKRIVEN